MYFIVGISFDVVVAVVVVANGTLNGNIFETKMFRKLDMRQVPTYPVPPAVWKSEEEKEPLVMDFAIETSRKNQSDYVHSFKTMIHLEEAAQTIFLKTFNQTNVRIFYSGSNRVFFFLNEVHFI